MVRIAFVLLAMDLQFPVLLVGLGNPGPKYASTRHNAGYRALDNAVQEFGLAVSSTPVAGSLWRGNFGGGDVLAFRADAFMNVCGSAIASVARYFKVPPTNCVVFHDEIDLASGKLRLKLGGSNAGHNGLRSIAQHFSSETYRFRIGVGHPGHTEAVVGHVLGRFSEREIEDMEAILPAAINCLPLLWRDGLDSARQQLGSLIAGQAARN